ncbi:hypothetical protein D6T64_11815 [Cryobacterium melibiosiphilum]|uniref:Uncharacterized protein n=1 Tax=Cryobacterium melibiosiphilum TaxID=995039 RepID=A0A3A5MJG7_9MICO|nr:hypothetical protein [Cryobacterium melibiosiphilum]RJT88069.1 hypothetical protein D6T64_11815 [Cryobacterium melibiosiphilum]
MTATRTSILPAYIRKGDLIRKEYTEPYCATHALEYVAAWNEDDRPPSDNLALASFFLLSRPVSPVVLPTVPGIYVDKDGCPWVLHREIPNMPQHWTEDREFMADSEALYLAPFTRLRPESDVAAEVFSTLSAEFAWLFGDDALGTRKIRFEELAAKWATK